MHTPFLLNYWFPELELDLKLLLIPIGVCSSVCQKAAVCGAVGKLDTAQLGAAQPCTGLTAPVPKSLHFNSMTEDNRWVEMGDDENSGILDSLKSQLLAHSNIAKLKFHSLMSQQCLCCFFLIEEEEQRDICACYKRDSGCNLLLNQIVL